MNPRQRKPEPVSSPWGVGHQAGPFFCPPTPANSALAFYRSPEERQDPPIESMPRTERLMFKRVRIAALLAVVATPSGSTPPRDWTSYLLSDSQVAELRTLQATDRPAFAGAMLLLYGPRH